MTHSYGIKINLNTRLILGDQEPNITPCNCFIISYENDDITYRKFSIGLTF